MAWQDLGKRMRRANALILNAERRYGRDSDIVKYIYKNLSSAYGVDFKVDKNGVVINAKKRFTTPPKESKLIEIAKIDRALKRVELSKSLTAQGRKETYEKSKMTWIERNLSKNADIFDQFIYAKEKIGHLIYGTSSQIIDELNKMPDGLSNSDYKKIINEYKRMSVDRKRIEEGIPLPYFFDFLKDRGAEIVNDRMEESSSKRFFGK